MNNQKLLETEHKKYTLHNNFCKTMSLFGNICYNKLYEFHVSIRRFILLSFILLYIDFFAPYFQFITRRMFSYFIWFLLGTLSSIGFGTGMQTGVLFVFPEIIATYQRNLEFYSDIYSNIYYTFTMCLPMVLIWGIGTAFGELPPYFIARKMNYKDSKGLDKPHDQLLGSLGHQ